MVCLRSPMAEAGDLKSLKYGFESHRRHHISQDLQGV